MKKILIPTLFSAVFAFVFSVEGDTSLPGVKKKEIFSGFKTERECEAIRDEYAAMLEMMGADVKVSKCVRQDAV